VELDKGLTVDEKEYPLSLTALALLGADLPAVDGLDGMASLYQSLQLEYKAETKAVLFQREMPHDMLPAPPETKKTPAHMAEWDTAYINDLPDSAFAYVKPGDKDDAGKTAPRASRYLPHHVAGGAVDLPHLRNALSRAPQTSLPPDAKAQAVRHLTSHARREGVGRQED